MNYFIVNDTHSYECYLRVVREMPEEIIPERDSNPDLCDIGALVLYQ